MPFNWQCKVKYIFNFFKKKCSIFLEIRKKVVLLQPQWDGSSVGLERMLDRHEVTSSLLVRPTFFIGSLAQLV